MLQYQKNKYLETTVQTASPAQLLIMLVDGAVRFCKIAIDALKNQHHEEANRHLTKVQDIILEFAITLDKESPLAPDLLKLYDYFIHRLIEANTSKTVEPAEEVLGYLVELKEMWVQAGKLANASGNMALHG